mmetsp:Transcript_9247/g.24428  ORF Transcript_9247/g.24428 Transcript_9247/m.24428 type:complete len:115 (+) Transcript_9247:970-1314(+)
MASRGVLYKVAQLLDLRRLFIVNSAPENGAVSLRGVAIRVLERLFRSGLRLLVPGEMQSSMYTAKEQLLEESTRRRLRLSEDTLGEDANFFPWRCTASGLNSGTMKRNMTFELS